MKLPPALRKEAFFTVDEVAAMSKHGRTAIYEHIKRKNLQIIKSGAKTLISRAAVIRWFKHLMQVGSIQDAESGKKATIAKALKDERQRTRTNAHEVGEIAGDRPHSSGLKAGKPIRATVQDNQAKIRKKSSLVMMKPTTDGVQFKKIVHPVKKARAEKKRNATEPGKFG